MPVCTEKGERPTCDQVWELLKEGCNAAEIAAAVGVDAMVAQSMVDEALGRPRGATLRAQARAPLTMRGA
ncbi:hypothetical protein AB8810_10985 [Xanthomonas sp. NCPPB 3005]|uniref:hypothetical protein n=1 Tax=Xanthomonas sp. NCPPB 3005 TaxID=3240913 RepID=UPI00351714C7